MSTVCFPKSKAFLYCHFPKRFPTKIPVSFHSASIQSTYSAQQQSRGRLPALSILKSADWCRWYGYGVLYRNLSGWFRFASDWGVILHDAACEWFSCISLYTPNRKSCEICRGCYAMLFMLLIFMLSLLFNIRIAFKWLGFCCDGLGRICWVKAFSESLSFWRKVVRWSHMRRVEHRLSVVIGGCRGQDNRRTQLMQIILF